MFLRAEIMEVSLRGLSLDDDVRRYVDVADALIDEATGRLNLHGDALKLDVTHVSQTTTHKVIRRERCWRAKRSRTHGRH